MSAPDTNLEKQERRHAGPLIGMAGGVILAIILLAAMILFVTSGDDGEGEADAPAAAVTVTD